MIFIPYLLVLGSAAAWSAGPTFLIQSNADRDIVETGREIFVRRCSGCHGIDAKGDGPAAAMLNPKPRNLREASFKFRSTPTGSPPTRDDILQVLDRGVVGTAMPSFRMVSTQEKHALVSYIFSLRTDWAESPMLGQKIPLPPAPEGMFNKPSVFLASALRGKKTFQEACVTCHGVEGKGNGDGAVGLVDEGNQPIRPADLSKPFIKSGIAAGDVFRTISTGLDGTPMPSFYDVYDDKTRWDTVAYVYFLRGKAAGLYQDQDLLPAKKSATPQPSQEKGSWQ